MKKLFRVMTLIVVVASVIALWIIFQQTDDRTQVEAVAKSTAQERLKALQKERPEEFEGEGGQGVADRYLSKFHKEEQLNELLRRDARAKGVSVSKSEFEDTFSRIEGSFEDTQQFLENLKAQGTTLKAYKDALEMQLLKTKMLENVTERIKVTSADVREYYKENLGRFADPADPDRSKPLQEVSVLIKAELTKERKAARFQEYLEGLTE